MNDTLFHVAAYYASLTNGSTNTAVAAVNDNVLTVNSASQFVLPKPGKLLALYSAGVSITRARVNTPSLRYVGLPYGGAVNAALAVPSPANLTIWGPMGPPMPFGDSISVEHTLGGGAPEVEFSLVWFGFGYRDAPPGPVYRILFTATITGVAGSWVSGTMTPDQTLPAGKYTVVGMSAIGTNLAAARLIFPGTMFRPGVLAANSVSAVPRKEWVDGTFGAFGQFSSINVPNLEILAIGANTAQTVFLDVVKTGDQP